jgi:protein AFG1
VQSAQRVVMRAGLNGGMKGYLDVRAKQATCQASLATTRALATVSDRPIVGLGPLEEYDRRVDAGILRNDEHQRGESLP